MMLLDEAVLDDGVARGKYAVRGDEFFLRGHFPGNPVVPGVILCEILAQSACVLFEGALVGGKTPMYTGIDKARFRTPVRPGDVIETEVHVVRAKGAFRFCEGVARVGGKICLTAEFSFAIVGA
jgi:3-hydroxyacyl-[acyl-carrier-protein] dehydratase